MRPSRRIRSTLQELAVVCGPDRACALARELTKLHEEVLRDTLGALAQRAIDDELTERGEFVIVVAASDGKVATASEAEIDAYFSELLSDGVRVRDVADAAAQRFNIAKRDAYDRAVRLSRSTARR